MRCLYCGKELALLKRWTGGGEFCSDAHRQSYQDEYNTLALNRLLQAQSNTGEPKGPAGEREAGAARQAGTSLEPRLSGLKPAEAAPVRPAQVTARIEAPAAVRAESPAIVESRSARPPVSEREPAAVRNGSEPAVESADAEAPAGAAGFLVEMPLPVMATVAAMAATDTDLECTAPPALPRGGFEDLETQLIAAGRIESAPFTRILDCAARPRDGRVEVREFVRGTPVIEVNFDSRASQVPEIAEETMELLIYPRPPQESPILWQELWREFEIDTELGSWTRVAFPTTGIEDNLDGDGPKSLSHIAPDETGETVSPAAAPELPSQKRAAEPAVEPEAERAAKREAIEQVPAQAVAGHGEPEAVKIAAKSDAPAVSKPVPATPPLPATPPSKPSFLRWPAPPKQDGASAQKTAAVEPPAKSEPKPVESKSKPVESKPVESVPTLATKALPLTLHGLSAGRGKPVQVFASPVWAGSDLQIPRSNALPMRPVMTLTAVATPAEPKKPAVADKSAGEKPTPEKRDERRPDRTVIVKVDPKKAQPARPDPRFANKGRKDEPAGGTKSTPAQTPANASIANPSTEAKDAAVKDKPIAEKPAADRTTAEEQAPEKSREKGREKGFPAPLAAPYHPPDLGIPSLNVGASGGFWTQLPMAGKAGLIVTVIGLIVGISFVLKSSAGSVATAGPQVVEAAPIGGAEASWITDWGVEPGVRKAHDISILRPSLNLTDYRVEFQAQIETKALGWVYRAQDEKNYYVTKLEVVKAGLEPTVALVRYAVIKGEEKPRAQFPLTMPLRIDTLYKIRFDALGDRFTTWVQDQKVDEWTDGQLKKGGVGLYSDRGERINLKGTLRVAPLVIKK